MQGPELFEKFITVSAIELIPETLKTSQLEQMIWEATLMAQHEDQATYYICGLSRQVLFQYKLLAIKHGLNLECISTHTLSLLSTYHSLHSCAFDDLTHHNFDIQQLMRTRALPSLAPHITKKQDCPVMAELIGLAIAGFSYENI